MLARLTGCRDSISLFGYEIDEETPMSPNSENSGAVEGIRAGSSKLGADERGAPHSDGKELEMDTLLVREWGRVRRTSSACIPFCPDTAMIVTSSPFLRLL